MSLPEIENLVHRIHAAGTQFVLAVTGGGSGAISALLETPGASRTILEAVVPYAAESLVAFLGAQPEQFCSERTARAMAMAAYQRALDYLGSAVNAPPLAGIGCTASLASDRPKHGPHRIHVALQTESLTKSQSLELTKGLRSRGGEETLAAGLILNLAAEACGLDDRLALELTHDEQIAAARCVAPQAWQDLLRGAIDVARAETAPTKTQARRVVFSGAFNPRHDGHRQMAHIAAERLGAPVEYEISVLNVDKPPIDFIEIERRAAQFTSDEPLWFTRAATFVEKSSLFPQATFVVGADTIVRIADPKYYGGDPQACRRALSQIAAAGCRFLVFGRTCAGAFRRLDDLALPAELRQICDEVPESAFHLDISSTELRERGEW